jgi:hypothetical protein
MCPALAHRHFNILDRNFCIPRANAKIKKKRCFNRKWGRGEGDFFWYGLAIYGDYILSRELYSI